MNAKKCDRCGRYYDKNEAHSDDGRCIFCMALYTTNGSCCETYDLCDDCISDLLKFMKSKDNGEKNETHNK